MLLEYCRRAASHYEAVNNHDGIARVTMNIGSILANTSDYPAALEQFHRVLAYHEANGNNIGSVHFNLGDYASALAAYEKARGVFDETQIDTLDTMDLVDPSIRNEREHLRAKVHEANGHLDDAVATLKSAIVIATEHNLRSQVAELHESLRDLALKRNDLAAYVEHNTAFTRITEEVNGKETAAKMAMKAKQREIDAREREHEKQLAVLHSTLPKHIADRVARGEQVNDHYDNAVVIFLDIVGFTSLSDQLSSAEVIQLLDTLFTSLDAVCKKHDVVKIKTIGDSYMAVSFPPSSASPRNDSHIVSAAHAALDMLEVASKPLIDILPDLLTDLLKDLPVGLQVRLGLHYGPVTAGVLGKERLQYDVWGDTVNVASRMESSGEPGKIHVSEAFAQLLTPVPSHLRERGASSQFPVPCSLIPRGTIEIKGKGLMTTYWLESAT